ncbi:lipopolysaccharide biosynthesis protein RfbH [archaeon]|jgi:CDP-4-dehydro-6-deoxyglucose reductase, E1|nr:lipopolysaccharide biosynthesis protein RfbH [archaeon]MBT6824233.1 lipopolysaccharide biosynthesis protein RfbH [archaeon]MBT7106771.1 lipopolysaccharide biosynthesis protein RfbH [archaeon]MBT7297535.1 lipopolysaccharide biosynthesis protein RfbH [archaeon]
MRTKEEIKKEINRNLKEYYESYLGNERKNIPVSGKKYDEKELISVVDALLDGVWTEGKVTSEFEDKFGKFLGIKYVAIVNSGSSANLLALKSLTSSRLGDRKLSKGDEIITVAAGFPTTINPIIECGCIPVFCDVDIETYNIDIEQLKDAISPKTKAIMLAHTLGNPFNINEVRRICKDHNLWLIEDACDALGSRYNKGLVGTFGDLATFSFYPAHHITMAEGGAVVTNNLLLMKIVKSIRDWGRDCWCKPGVDNTCKSRYSWKLGDLPQGYDHKYIYSELGYNLKNTDLNVAIGLAQLDKLNDFIEKRKENFKMLYKGLEKFEEYFYLPKQTTNSEPSWFGFLLTIKDHEKFKREDILKHLNSEGIDTRLLFGGNIIKQPYFIKNNPKFRIVQNLNNTEKIMNDTFWVGICPLINEEDINKIILSIGSFISQII